jgi:hypothetical protein
MAEYKIQGTTIEMGRALTGSEVDGIRNAVSDAAAITLFEGFTPYVELPKVQNIGQFGLQQNIITGSDIKTGRVFKASTTKDSGDVTLDYFFDSANSVQQTLLTAAEDGGFRAFRVTLNDDSPTSPSSPSLFYFAGIVSGFNQMGGGVDDWVMVQSTIAINTQVILVPRTE